ncbi:hypothetical protein ACQKWADRAFT_301505 [Trichoderma austrokoningii]
MTLRFFSCSIPECDRPSVRAVGGCDSCNRHLCLTHLSRRESGGSDRRPLLVANTSRREESDPV